MNGNNISTSLQIKLIVGSYSRPIFSPIHTEGSFTYCVWWRVTRYLRSRRKPSTRSIIRSQAPKGKLVNIPAASLVLSGGNANEPGPACLRCGKSFLVLLTFTFGSLEALCAEMGNRSGREEHHSFVVSDIFERPLKNRGFA